ncbi:MAG: hypothetical protein HYR96_04850 [Deltaproteobacteria bacterium]|nr:hypothetical protein [Deltaproteobacteria bacterium]MBI3294584.1 hypothetical protein [Deltaproteobacteria bacterium]
MGAFQKVWGWIHGAVRPFQQNALARLLDRLKGASTLEQKTLWLKDWAQWLRKGAIPPEFLRAGEEIHSCRLRYFLESITRQEGWRTSVASTLYTVLTATRGLELFCQTGMNEEQRFLAELVNRSLKRFLPTRPDWEDFAFTFSTVFSKKTDADWIRQLDVGTIGTTVAAVEAALGQSGARFQALRESTSDAVLLLSAQLLAMSQGTEVRRRRPHTRIESSPFFRLNDAIRRALLESSQESRTSSLANCEELIQLCRNDIAQIYAHLEESGVSISLVFSLDHQSQILRRLDSLVVLLLSNEESRYFSTLSRFISDLIREHFETQSLGSLINSTLRLLSRKIVERTGISGEHYITRTGREYFSMLNSAAGGGILTVGTTYFKMAIGHLGLAPFLEGLLQGINYAGSFVTMQLCGFTLSSKQPSMTAATLAGKLRDFTPEGQKEFVEEVAMIARSQFASAIGNVGAAIPISICVDWLSRILTHHPIVGTEKAGHIIHSLDPFDSPTVVFAALTGVILWLSSICAGWFENWWVCRQVPQAIETNPTLNRWLGHTFAHKLSHWLSHQVSGFAGNISVGFLLAFTPVLGGFFGLPMDVRHVTLSTASLTLALCSVWGGGLAALPVGASMFGIFTILCMNLGVSFLLALFIAAKARGLPGLSPWPILKPIIEGLLKAPARFFFPVHRKAETRN